MPRPLTHDRQGAFHECPHRTALKVVCDIGFRHEVVYGDALTGVSTAAQPVAASGKAGKVPATPVGPACRLCERAGCLARAEPPVTKPLRIDEMLTRLSA